MSTYIGKICNKHPELGGLRQRSNWTCIGCRKDIRIRWENRHPEKKSEYNAQGAKKWRKNNPELAKIIAQKSRRKSYNSDPERHRQRSRSWAKKYPGKINARTARRTAQKLRATPTWAEMDIINCIYQMAAAYRSAGVSCEVDHIVPLRSKLVCGLHCAANLTLLNATSNMRKGNRYWPDIPIQS
jgi:hypothetical protein